MYVLIKNKIQKEILIQITNLKENYKNNSVSFKCCHNKDVESTIEHLSKILGYNYQIKTEKLRNPKIKVVGISNDMSLEDIENDINKRNFQDYSDKCKIIYTYKTFKHSISAIIQIPIVLYTHVRNNNFFLFIGVQKCHTFDYFDLLPCKKCGRFGHS